MALRLTALDHLVLSVSDKEKTVQFYTCLSMQHREFSPGRSALFFGSQKINLHTTEEAASPKAAQPHCRTADFCLPSDPPMQDILNTLQHLSISVVLGPVVRSGAASKLHSIYINDPDGNLIEIAHQIDKV
ncbi:MAG: VOC family protein [Proteobacteria bacterium]|nr:VOC family protein [Pseudomonadota bacterium]MBU1058770.1 VOC family protein [Pseudomonadota bacterium]